MHMCVLTHEHGYVCMCEYACVVMYACICIHVCMRTCMHVCAHMHGHVYVFVLEGKTGLSAEEECELPVCMRLTVTWVSVSHAFHGHGGNEGSLRKILGSWSLAVSSWDLLLGKKGEEKPSGLESGWVKQDGSVA